MTARPMGRAFAGTAALAGILTAAAPAMAAGAAAPPESPGAAAPPETAEARRILDAAGVKGGLIVHLGCGDGRLTVALRAGDAYLVHGLDADPADVEAARAKILSLGLCGKVSVDRFDGKRLPYAENIVNLLVAEDLGVVSMAEVLRVLVPRGVACVKARGRWQKTVKPWPDAMDEWTHYLHGPGNNAVARDAVVGPPRRLRWWAEPRWSRSHEYTSSLAAMVSAGGRIFYVFDEGLTGVTDPRLPEAWRLIARDAFSGVCLWKRPLPEWRGAEWKTRSLRGRPGSVARRLVARGDRLYVTVSHRAGLSVLDAATGRTLREVPGTEGAQEIILSGDTLLLRLAGAGKAGGSIAAVDAETGAVRWRIPAPSYTAESLAADPERVIYHTGKQTVCLARADGRERWRADSARPRPKRIILHGGVVLEAGGSRVVARSARTGRVLWSVKGGGRSMRDDDVFVARGRVWRAVADGIAGHDPATGEVKGVVDPSGVQSPGHHLRCYPAKATERYLITQYRGAEFVSLTGGPHVQNDWLRGPCRYGILPCNGLLYVPPNPCFCYPGAMVRGFLALAPEGGEPEPVPGPDRLLRGPAFDEARALAAAGEPAAGDWPTYRHDPRRSGAAGCTVPARVAPRWTVEVGGRLTPPVVAGGRLYVAARDAHTLHALDAEDGRRLWRFTAGGRIDSPPTVCGGLATFGCADGSVYALRASDGALAWRFRAAPSDRRIVSAGQLESPWRVHGSLLAKNGLLYGTAGRSTFLDGGIRLFALDPGTGRVVHETRIDTWSPTRADAEDEPILPGYYMEGARSDILVSEGPYVYLGPFKFDLKLAREEVPYILPDPHGRVRAMPVGDRPFTAVGGKEGEGYEVHQREWLERTQKAPLAERRRRYGGWSLGDRRIGLHVFAMAGFLDDSWFNRTFWMYAETWPGYYIANLGAKTGQLLVVGPARTYAVQAFPRRNLQSPLFTPGGKGYLLLADRNDNEPILDDHTRGTTKGWGFTRKEPPEWFAWVPIRIRAMVLAGGHLFVAGPPDVVDPADPMAAFEGRKGAVMRAVSAAAGGTLAAYRLQAPPVFDGLIAAEGRLYLADRSGRVRCFAPAK